MITRLEKIRLDIIAEYGSIREYAKRYGMRPDVLYRVLHGGNPSLNTAREMAERLKVRVKDIYDMINEEKMIRRIEDACTKDDEEQGRGGVHGNLHDQRTQPDGGPRKTGFNSYYYTQGNSRRETTRQLREQSRKACEIDRSEEFRKILDRAGWC